MKLLELYGMSSVLIMNWKDYGIKNQDVIMQLDQIWPDLDHKFGLTSF